MGGTISTANGDERLARVAAYAQKNNLSRAEAIRQLLDRGLEQPARIEGDLRQLQEQMEERNHTCVWAMLRIGEIDTSQATGAQDGTYDLIIGDERISCGPATTETGEAAEGWDWTKYVREDNVWEYVTNDWADTDAEMLAILQKLTPAEP